MEHLQSGNIILIHPSTITVLKGAVIRGDEWVAIITKNNIIVSEETIKGSIKTEFNLPFLKNYSFDSISSIFSPKHAHLIQKVRLFLENIE